ncbi:MAG TPA: M48 family metallopeptidase [Candidatus Bathyarchaeia archaeon]|nr:M48 family metallopeptidase [Candidatus Bathyarchaeia archaeon]
MLEAPTDLWLRIEEFQTSSDRSALELVRATGILPYIVNQLLVKPKDRKLRELISGQGIPLNHFRDLERVVQEVAYVICLETLPAIYVVTMTGAPNAFTFGTDDAPVIVVDRRLVEKMGVNELRALLGHEMGHIKSGHMLYHSLAQTLAGGIEMSASLMGFNMISMPMRLALLAWQRESEFSADRASLVASGASSHVVAMFATLVGMSGVSIEKNTSLLDNVTGLFQTHPNLSLRAAAVLKFSKSEEYDKIVKTMAHRRLLRLALSPTCRFCGSAKEIKVTFCPTCGKSQI